MKLNASTVISPAVVTLTSVPNPASTVVPTPVNQSLSAQPVTLNATNSFEKFTNTGKSTISRAFDVSGLFGKKSKPKSIDKMQIGAPTQFVHVGHVGLNNNNFDVI